MAFTSTALAAVLLAGMASLWSPPGRSLPMDPQVSKDAPGKFVTIGGLKTHYTVQGEGEGLIVLVHGLGWGWEEAFGRVIPKLTKESTVMAYDIYGRGFSDGTTKSHDLALYVSQLAQLLLKLEAETGGKSLKPFTLVGYSMGGVVVSGFAKEYPHLVEKLILMAPAGVNIPMPPAAQIVKMPIVGDLLVRFVGASLMKSELPNGHFAGEDFDPKIRKYREEQLDLRVSRHAGYLDSILSSLRHMPLTNNEEILASLESLGFSIDIIWGENDNVCPYGPASEGLRKLIPKAKLHTIKECGHDDLVENKAAELAAVIRKIHNN
mmetsp:Transcript_11441/g.28177  ORF Transcript_11441/g.28177 Transcript_11441/m.28177 type:complete len:322 (-) Transcript_11441:285-1250(-)|eukprot:CAMPEP_0114525938 /NCGR_PEP_ID=MMETSP0109-20121206/22715_1 /TAXON_ID=29199 /ORGANISM="Chlorarachnion reptans, Strain CCCM449" /LENGTH=321 /DNA_ID=CAMNT_0001707601 /DNA_START=134 /DNA_END=1099 /DNA_ORIENTATION=-